MDELKTIITRIAWSYYINNCTQQEIANKMNLSRTKVTRYLQKAKEMGIVNISISMDYGYCFEKEDKIRQLLDIEEVRVIPSNDNQDEAEYGIGIAGAMRMNRLLTADDILGVAWGKSLYSVAKNLQPVKPRDGKHMQVVQLMGGLSTSDKINPEEVVKMIASRLDAHGNWLNVPAIVSSKEAKEILMNDEMIAQVFNKTKTCNICMLGIGDLSGTSSLYETGSYDTKDLQELKDAGAVGDIISRTYDIEGNPVNTSLSERIIAVTLDDIKKIDKRIAFAIGQQKVKAIIGAIRGGYINELITDENTADNIIKFIEEKRL